MILIIDKDKKERETISDIFYYMGIISYPVSPTEAYSELSPVYKAVLISNPENIPDLADYVNRLRGYSRKTPVFSISQNPDDPELNKIFDICFPVDIYSSTLAVQIANFQKKFRIPVLGVYGLAGIDASCDARDVEFFGRPIPMTKTHKMIFRYLCASYPEKVSAKKILKYAFKCNKKPEISAVRTHISTMNKNFNAFKGRNLIVTLDNGGYVVLTPEVRDELFPPGTEGYIEDLYV